MFKVIAEQQQRFSVEECCRIAKEVAEGVRAMHYDLTPQILHRDLTPYNILINEQGCVKICDLGISTQKRSKGIQALSPIGHPEFKPPEVTLQQSYSKRCDVFTFGSFLYFLFTGSTPFHSEGYSGFEISRRFAEGRTPIIPNEVPTCIAQTIQKCWRMECKNRPNFKKLASVSYTHLTLPTSDLV